MQTLEDRWQLAITLVLQGAPRLDDPWSEGNPLRAELGRMVGRTSVPCVFIGGAYVGGFDGGVDGAASPGILDLAFQGKLRPLLEDAGAL